MNSPIDQHRTRPGKLPACPVELSLQLVGSKWKVLVLRELIQGPLRFSELARRLHPVSGKVLTTCLRSMEDDGLLTRTVYAEIPPRVVYELTEIGSKLDIVLEAMDTFGEQYRAAVSQQSSRP